MKIHIVLPGPLFPMTGMSQVRTYNEVIRLGKDHNVVFTDLISKSQYVNEARDKLAASGVDYRPVFTPNFGKNRIRKAIRIGWNRLAWYVTNLSKEEISLGVRSVRKQLLGIASGTGADVFLIHYWYLGSIFRYLPQSMLRVIDTHYVVEENIELLESYSMNPVMRYKKKHELVHCLKMQRKYFLGSDLIIVNSKKQSDLISKWNPRIPVQVTVNGQDLEPYLSYSPDSRPEMAVCFYGSLSNQFNRKALSRVLDHIYPLIKSRIPEVRLYIVGANPPADIAGRDESIIVTGYVEDIRPVLAKCKVNLLPLDTGSGFRGRVVELMALGIPVVGTSNGLQSVDFSDQVHGILAETNAQIAEGAVRLMSDENLRQEMASNCKEHARARFSLEATFGDLSARMSILQKSRGSTA